MRLISSSFSIWAKRSSTLAASDDNNSVLAWPIASWRITLCRMRSKVAPWSGPATADCASAAWLSGRARQVVLFFAHGHLRFAAPVGYLVLVLFLLFLQQMLVGNGDCHLRLHLKQLVFHVQDHLLDHDLRMLRFVDQFV